MTDPSEATIDGMDVNVTIPERESDAYEVLAAWYSGFSYAEHYRKITLASAREIIRARYALRTIKITETRLDDLCRLAPVYLDFLARHLEGRILYERAFLARGGIAT